MISKYEMFAMSLPTCLACEKWERHIVGPYFGCPTKTWMVSGMLMWKLHTGSEILVLDMLHGWVGLVLSTNNDQC